MEPTKMGFDAEDQVDRTSLMRHLAVADKTSLTATVYAGSSRPAGSVINGSPHDPLVLTVAPASPPILFICQKG